MSLLRKMAIPLLVGSMAFTSLPLSSSSLADSEESKENNDVDIIKLLSLVEKIKKILPSFVSAGENGGKKGFYYAWDLNGDGFYNLIIFHDFYPGTIVKKRHLTYGILKPSPYSIFLISNTQRILIPLKEISI